MIVGSLYSYRMSTAFYPYFNSPYIRRSWAGHTRTSTGTALELRYEYDYGYSFFKKSTGQKQTTVEKIDEKPTTHSLHAVPSVQKRACPCQREKSAGPFRHTKQPSTCLCSLDCPGRL
eukprot:scaffold452403_cov23-Prasinocladus_malaysianus.AAC.1